MTNCNDCIHEQTCDQSSRQMWSLMAGELDCTDFKDRQNYVELVRCKDCKYWDEENKELYTYDSKPENKDNLVDFAECLYWSNWSTCHSTRFNDFCSLGERREGE